MWSNRVRSLSQRSFCREKVRKSQPARNYVKLHTSQDEDGVLTKERIPVENNTSPPVYSTFCE